MINSHFLPNLGPAMLLMETLRFLTTKKHGFANAQGLYLQ